MTDQLLSLLDRVDPVDRERVRALPAPEDELQAILATTVTAAPPPRRPRLRRVVPLAAGVAVAIVAAAALLPGEEGGASPEAAQALESAAAVAAAEAPPGAAAGYAYSRVRQVYLSTTGAVPITRSYSFYMPTTIESWIAPDGSGRVRETREPIEWPGPRDERRWRASGHPFGSHQGTTDRRFGPGELDRPPAEGELPAVGALPTDPGELAPVFEDERNDSSGSVPLNAKMFEYGASVLLQPASSPALRSATYEVLAGIEGVELAGEARDPLGRPGTEVSITATYSGNIPERYSLIYDAETAHPLAYTERLLEPVQYIDSRLTSYTVLEESGVVPSLRERP